MRNFDVVLPKSSCCNSNIVASKGSYMGQTHWVCSQCRKYLDEPDTNENGHDWECNCFSCGGEDVDHPLGQSCLY